MLARCDQHAREQRGDCELAGAQEPGARPLAPGRVLAGVHRCRTVSAIYFGMTNYNRFHLKCHMCQKNKKLNAGRMLASFGINLGLFCYKTPKETYNIATF